jgi:hypothetical protein
VTASVTPIEQAPSVRVKHSWAKAPRLDDPERHVYTCRRDACGLMRRSELVDGVWLELWLWPDRSEGSGRTWPACRGGEVLPLPEADVPTPVSLAVVSSPRQAVSAGGCCRCVPPCGRPTRLYLGGYLCEFQAGLLSAARLAATKGGIA